MTDYRELSLSELRELGMPPRRVTSRCPKCGEPTEDVVLRDEKGYSACDQCGMRLEGTGKIITTEWEQKARP